MRNEEKEKIINLLENMINDNSYFLTKEETDTIKCAYCDA